MAAVSGLDGGDGKEFGHSAGDSTADGGDCQNAGGRRADSSLIGESGPRDQKVSFADSQEGFENVIASIADCRLSAPENASPIRRNM
jgi:hypothetical protein